MKLYSLQGEHLNLHCGEEKCRDNNFMHYIIGGEIETSDWKHLLEEFPNHLTKVNPDAIIIPEEVKEELEETNDGLIS